MSNLGKKIKIVYCNSFLFRVSCNRLIPKSWRRKAEMFYWERVLGLDVKTKEHKFTEMDKKFSDLELRLLDTLNLIKKGNQLELHAGQSLVLPMLKLSPAEAKKRTTDFFGKFNERKD